MQYLVDSDWAIHYMRDVQDVVYSLRERFPHGVGMSIISLAELYEGLVGSTSPHDAELNLQRLLDEVEEVVSLDDAICREFARQRAQLRSAGNIIGDFDILIGSTAIVHGLTLLTNNRRHFERLPGLRIVSA